MCDKDQFSALCYFLIHVNDMPMAAMTHAYFSPVIMLRISKSS